MGRRNSDNERNPAWLNRLGFLFAVLVTVAVTVAMVSDFRAETVGAFVCCFVAWIIARDRG